MDLITATLRAVCQVIGLVAARNTESSVYLGCQSNEYIDQMEV